MAEKRRLLLPNGQPYIPDNIANFHRRANAALQAGKAEREGDDEIIKEMRLNRKVAISKQADIGASQVSFATGRSRDPMFYWRQTNLPFDYQKEEELIKLRNYARLIYLTHPVIASCIDVYSHWPLTGMHFECLAGETEVITSRGTFPIRDLAGGVHRIVTRGSKWTDAKFENYGQQKLYRITIERNRRAKDIYATAGHRWFLAGGEKLKERRTRTLEPGDVLASAYVRNCVSTTVPSTFGIAQGIVFGDGSCDYAYRAGGGSYVELYGEKNLALLKFFNGSRTREYRDERCAESSIRVIDLPRAWKELPSLEESTSFLYGWLSGYFAADGSVSKTGEVTLASNDLSNLKFVRTLCHRLGIATAAPYVAIHKHERWVNGRRTAEAGTRGWILPLDGRDLTEAFFHIEEHRQRWIDRSQRPRPKANWRVIGVEETDRFEDVYCAEVPGTASFALEDNLLTGNCKDDALNDFYSEMFFDDLNYEEFLPDVAHSYWLMGEALPLGQFNETLGVWEDEELINPDDVNVIRSPFLKEPRFEMRVPEEIREIITKREPEWEYRQLVRAYPELVRYAQTEEFMPVSSVLMKQIALRSDKFFHRGIPIIMRAFRYIYQEEMLNAAVDSIASRLYTPLILVRLGATATDMGTEVAWVPDAGELQEFEMALDTALAADFRVLTSHFATQVDQVFGRESMPDFSSDYDRLMDRQLMAFGLSRTLLMGSDTGETYAGDALNRDLVTMLLSRLRRYVVRFYKERAYVVAKAQGHYDYEEQGGQRVPIMEEKLIIDADGTKRVIEEPKLLIPDLKFDTMNLQDENTMRQFKESLRDTGVPISNQTRLVNVGIDLEDEYELVRNEQVRMAVETQETRKQAYLELKNKRLPIPPDLLQDFEAKAVNADEVEAAQAAQPGGEEGPMPLPNEMIDPATDTVALTPTMQDYQQAGGDDVTAEGDAPADASPGADMDAQVLQLLMQRQRPPESDEQRGRMPKPGPGQKAGKVIHMVEGMETPYMDEIITEGANRLISGPRHVEPGEDRVGAASL